MDDNAVARKKVVLVVEDEQMLLDAITKKLTNSGYEAVPCEGGAQALAYLNSHAHDVLPDVIWLDYYLKDMNGIELMNQLKTDPKFQQIPVVVVSNSASADKVHHMLALGATKYIVKADYRLDQIIEMIKEIL